ncbi:WD40 repeat-like protein [Lactarius akahatsu]|uniref:WD40 repeat-like protein n=1 Tax=Lactarius akahatsu TaxID=416441 RepID=A0AAD4LRB2_9AGAM|nr:WD40 repeat-like protein [Lactarius akahatsu]
MVPSNEQDDHRAPKKPGKSRRHRRAKPRSQEIFAEEPAQASTSGNTEPKSWPWVAITESSSTRHPVVFTKDGSYFFSIVGSSVRIYSTTTGLVTPSRLPILNPHNAYQLITGSLDGHVKVWDFLDGVLLQTIGVGNPVRHIAAHEQWKDFLFVAVARPSKKRKGNGDDDNGVVLRVSLKSSLATLDLPVQSPSESVLVGKTRTTRGLAVSAGGSWLVAIGGHKAYVASTANLKAGFIKFVSPEALTCLALHPTEEYFATGDEKGNIRLWYCLHEHIAVPVAEVEKRAPTSTLHWHAHAVSALSFTANGAYLLSGGEESVLVIWQIHSGKREFVPRVGAPINSVAISQTQSGQEEYLLCLADASFVFVSAAKLKITRSYSGIKLDPAISHSRPSTSVPTPLAVHTLSSTLILPSSHPSSLQTYSPSSSKLISELEVSPSNRVSRRDEKMLEPSRVQQAVISSSGEWLATIDSQVYLKVWRWESSVGLWALNTRIDRPHGLAEVTSIAFSPNDTFGGTFLVTSGKDGHLKSWRIRSVTDKKTGISDVFWVARSSLTFKREIPWSVAWSPDGSLLAVAFGTYVAIYDPSSNALIRAFTASELRGPAVVFLPLPGLSDVVLWDLVKQKGKPFFTIPFVRFAVFYSQPPNSTVSIFDSSSSIPSGTYTLPFTLRNIVWYPQSLSKAKVTSTFHLVGITDSWDVVLCGDDAQPLAEEGSCARAIVSGSHEPQKRTLFQDIFGDSALTSAPVRPIVAVSSPKQWNSKEIANVFDGPAYLIPALDTLFDTLMSHFLTPSMDIDEPLEGPPVGVPRPERIVDTQEMEAFIELFRHHGVKASSSAPLPQPLNGCGPKIHSNAHKNMNGHSHTPKSKPKINNDVPRPSPGDTTGHSSPGKNSPRTVVTSSPALTGQKRKTSS